MYGVLLYRKLQQQNNITVYHRITLDLKTKYTETFTTNGHSLGTQSLACQLEGVCSESGRGIRCKQTDEGTENKAGRVVQVRFCINGLFLKNRKYIGLIIRIMISKKKKEKK